MMQCNRLPLLAGVLVVSIAAACGGDKSPSSPSSTTPGPPDGARRRHAVHGRAARHAAADAHGQERHVRSGLRHPQLRVPGVGQQHVQQRRDRLQQSPGSRSSSARRGVAENTGGKTSFQPDQDLQPTTRYYWRARLVQGTAQSEWSAAMTFKTKLVGYNRAGELYDPLIHGETVGDRIGSTDFIPGKGLRVNSNTSYIRYLLPGHDQQR